MFAQNGKYLVQAYIDEDIDSWSAVEKRVESPSRKPFDDGETDFYTKHSSFNVIVSTQKLGSDDEYEDTGRIEFVDSLDDQDVTVVSDEDSGLNLHLSSDDESKTVQDEASYEGKYNRS